MNLQVTTVGHPNATVQMLVFMGIRAQLDAFELTRVELLAAAWQAQVTVVDIPGNGHGYAHLTSTERTQLRTGRFDAVADRMVATAANHHPNLSRSPVVALGYSMGASLATAAAAGPNTLRINKLVLVEPVAIRKWSLAELLRSVHAEQPHINTHLNPNRNGDNGATAWYGPTTGVHFRDWVDLGHLGFAVSRGTLYSDMLRAQGRNNCTLQLIHATDSRLARRRDVQRFTRSCRSAGIPIDVIEMPGHHAFWHSLSDVAVVSHLATERVPR